MLIKLMRRISFRNFSNSVIGKNVEKKTETPTSSKSSSQGFILSRIPTKFEKKIMMLSGKYKTEEEIPKYITSEILDKAQSKVRIKIANLMILVAIITCGIIIYQGKNDRKEKIRRWEEKQKEAAQVK